MKKQNRLKSGKHYLNGKYTDLFVSDKFEHCPDTYVTKNMEVEGNLWVEGKIYNNHFFRHFLIYAVIGATVGTVLGNAIVIFVLEFLK